MPDNSFAVKPILDDDNEPVTTVQGLACWYSDRVARTENSVRLSMQHDPLGPERNEARAVYGAASVIGYLKLVEGAEEEVRIVVKDMIADLMHLCDGLGIDIHDVVEAAGRYHQEEVA